MAAESERRIKELVAKMLGGVESWAAKKAVRELEPISACPTAAALIRRVGGEQRLEVMAGADEMTASLARTILAQINGTGPKPVRLALAKSSAYGQRPAALRIDLPKKRSDTPRKMRSQLATLGDYIAAEIAAPSRRSKRSSAASSAGDAQMDVATGSGDDECENKSPAQGAADSADSPARADRYAQRIKRAKDANKARVREHRRGSMGVPITPC